MWLKIALAIIMNLRTIYDIVKLVLDSGKPKEAVISDVKKLCSGDACLIEPDK